MCTKIDQYLTEDFSKDSVGIPIETRIQTLPFSALSWENFERLCFVLGSRLMECIETSQVYGRRGQKQEGIDLYFNKDGRRILWQIKRYQKASDINIKEIVDYFCEGKWINKTDTFGICLSCKCDDIKLTDQFDQCYEELDKKGIKLTFYHSDTLSELLKSFPDIVSSFFGDNWRKALVGENTEISLRYEEIVNEQKQLFYENSLKLLDEAKEEIESRIEKFNKELMSKLFSIKNDIEGIEEMLKDPQFSIDVNKAQKRYVYDKQDDMMELLHTILVNKYIKDKDRKEDIFYKSVIDVLEKLNVDDINFITVCYLIDYYYTNIKDESDKDLLSILQDQELRKVDLHNLLSMLNRYTECLPDASYLESDISYSLYLQSIGVGHASPKKINLYYSDFNYYKDWSQGKSSDINLENNALCIKLLTEYPISFCVEHISFEKLKDDIKINVYDIKSLSPENKERLMDTINKYNNISKNLNVFCSNYLRRFELNKIGMTIAYFNIEKNYKVF